MRSRVIIYWVKNCGKMKGSLFYKWSWQIDKWAGIKLGGNDWGLSDAPRREWTPSSEASRLISQPLSGYKLLYFSNLNTNTNKNTDTNTNRNKNTRFNTKKNPRLVDSSPNHCQGTTTLFLKYELEHKYEHKYKYKQEQNQILTRKKNPRPIGWTPQTLHCEATTPCWKYSFS